MVAGVALWAMIPAYAASEGSGVELTVQPNLCVLGEGESVCRDQVKVNWRAEHSRSLCLYELGEPDPLDCWQQTRSGTHTSMLETENDVQFQLIEASGRQVVASRAFEVIADAKRYRRRRRNPWSFF